MHIELENEIMEVLEQNGIYISNDWDEELEFDSITFISTIVCLEETFDIQIPSEMLVFENFRTFRVYVDNVEKILASEL